MDAELEDRIEALIEVGRHADAADLCVAHGDVARAGELYAAVWKWDQAIAITEQHGLFDHAYRHALTGKDREACGRLLARLEEHPEQAQRAATYAEDKGLPLEAARLREAAGELEPAAELYERAGELKDAARLRLALGQPRPAGMLYEKRLREDPKDAESSLALGRILAQFGRWEHAVRALQRAAEDPREARAALRLLVACFAAMGMDEAAGSRLDALRASEPALPVTVPAFLEAEFGDARGLVARGEAERFLAGRYRVIGPLGAGATGRVLLAHDAFHDREVAVKVLHVGGGSVGRDAFVRFAREARVAAGISHPNVVQVFEFNPEGPFLVMEHMAGGTLEGRLEAPDGSATVVPPLELHHIARSVLAALEAVHRRGVVHRDLKPANIMFGQGGDVKLGDFGVAHLTDLGATLTGAMVGTLAYMAPEQITAAQRPDASTDLYALGVILFRCLTGRLPFRGPDFVAQHLEETPPAPSSVAPWVPPEFDAVVLGALEKDPRARPSSATELLDALRALPWGALQPPSIVAPVGITRPSEPPPPETGDRYRVTHPLRRGVSVAYDELLERSVQIVAIGPEDVARIRLFARADHPYLQAVFELDEERGRAVLEHPSGAPWLSLSATDPRRSRAIGELREALAGLHHVGAAHGAVDARHVVVGVARSCLLLPLAHPLAHDTDASTDADWERLASLEAGSAPKRADPPES